MVVWQLDTLFLRARCKHNLVLWSLIAQRGTPGYIAPELRGLDENDELSPSMGRYSSKIAGQQRMFNALPRASF